MAPKVSEELSRPEKLVPVYETVRRQNPEDRNLEIHLRENLEYHIMRHHNHHHHHHQQRLGLSFQPLHKFHQNVSRLV